MTISNQTKLRHKKFKPLKQPEKRSLLHIKKVPSGSRAIGTGVSAKFCVLMTATLPQHGYEGTVISYSRQCYVISLDGCGPEHNEIMKSLKSAVEKGELKCC